MTVIAGFFDDINPIEIIKDVVSTANPLVGAAISIAEGKDPLDEWKARFEAASAVAEGDFDKARGTALDRDVFNMSQNPFGQGGGLSVLTPANFATAAEWEAFQRKQVEEQGLRDPSSYAWYDPRRYMTIAPPPAYVSQLPDDLRHVATLEATSARAVGRQLAAEAAAREAAVRGSSSGGGSGSSAMTVLLGVAAVGGALYLAHRFMKKRKR